MADLLKIESVLWVLKPFRATDKIYLSICKLNGLPSSTVYSRNSAF